MAEQELVAALGKVPLFSALSEKDLKRVAGSFSERTVPAGQEIVIEGRGGVGFFVIGSGEASVTKDGEEVRTLGPGDYFGEMALIDKRERSATVVAGTDLQCYGMTAWSFRPVVESHGEIAWALLETLVARLREAETSSAD
jgi:CRP/FNR family transcriptional regulator, cyclic AMP receptor protein